MASGYPYYDFGNLNITWTVSSNSQTLSGTQIELSGQNTFMTIKKNSLVLQQAYTVAVAIKSKRLGMTITGSAYLPISTVDTGAEGFTLGIQPQTGEILSTEFSMAVSRPRRQHRRLPVPVRPVRLAHRQLRPPHAGDQLRLQALRECVVFGESVRWRADQGLLPDKMRLGL